MFWIQEDDCRIADSCRTAEQDRLAAASTLDKSSIDLFVVFLEGPHASRDVLLEFLEVAKMTTFVCSSHSARNKSTSLPCSQCV